MGMKGFVYPLILAIFLFYSNCIYANSIKVVFINPGHPKGDTTGAFWSNVNRFMQAAANDLNIKLTTLYANRNHILMKSLATGIAKYKPDYVVIVNEKGVGVELVKSIARHKIPIFTLLNKLDKDERLKLTKQQQSLIIGSLTPNNRLAGKRLMADLLKLHNQKPVKKKLYNVLAIQGDYRSAAALERKKGLELFITSNSQLDLLDSPTANWSQQEAYQKVKGLLKRAPIDIIWAANDPMAVGAKKAVTEANLPYPVTIGGFNWDKPDEKYTIDISYGGHVILGAKALVMLSDFHNQIMLPCEMHLKLDIFRPSNGNNLQLYASNTRGKKLERFDFSRFSKAHSNTASFDLMNFISQEYLQLASSYDANECSNQLISLNKGL